MSGLASDQLLRGTISLTGSAQLVSEFFYFGLNSILYQRGIYPADLFERQERYGLVVLVSNDERITKYLKNITSQLEKWLLDMVIQKLVLVIKSVATGETVERWQFDVKCDKSAPVDGKGGKPEKEVKGQIRDVIRQIVATVTFLPLLEGACSFDILAYTDKDVMAPVDWADGDPHFIANAQEVKLKSFETAQHKVQPLVCFKRD